MDQNAHQVELDRLNQAKAGLQTLLTTNGVSIPSGAKMDELVELTEDITVVVDIRVEKL